jgi:hypothetical protein
MTKVQITPDLSIELSQLLKGVAQLDVSELEQFSAQVNLILAQRKVPSLSQAESMLLSNNSIVSPAIGNVNFYEPQV